MFPRPDPEHLRKVRKETKVVARPTRVQASTQAPTLLFVFAPIFLGPALASASFSLCAGEES